MRSQGYTQKEVAETVGITRQTVNRWERNLEFASEVDRLSLMVGIASRAERLRIAMRVARQKVGEDGSLKTSRDLLDWLKFAQSETDGVKLNLVTLLDDALAVAGGGSGGIEEKDRAD